MLNITSLLKHAAKGDTPNIAVVLGSGPSARFMRHTLIATHAASGRETVVTDVRSGSEAMTALSAYLDKVVVLEDAAEHLQSADVPTLSRVRRSKSSGLPRPTVVITGQHTDPEVRAELSRTGAKVYEAGFTSTAASKKSLREFLTAATGISDPLAHLIVTTCSADEQRCWDVATKAAVVGPDVEPALVQDWCSEQSPAGYVGALLRGDVGAGTREALNVPQSRVQSVLSTLLDEALTASTVYPVVLRQPKPSVAAAKEYKIPLPVLTRHWDWAGRFGPVELTRRVGLIDHHMTRARKPGCLEALALMW